jgi:hypothetical protein
MIKIILFLVVIVVIYLIYQNKNKNKKLESFEDSEGNEGNEGKCNLDIDNLYIYDRDKTYNKYINKVIDNNNNINYTKEEIEIMKNKHQFYNLDDKKNISNLVLGECKNSYGGGDKISTYDIGGGSYYGYNSNVTGGFNSDIKEMKGYGDVKGAMIDKGIDKSTCDHNLDNYYYDLSGNNIKSTLQQYRKDDNDSCIPITYTNENIKDTVKSSMIIPNTYNINKDLTNAYDVNWSKVLNPLTIY